MLCVTTKIIHARMNIICERESLNGMFNMGFANKDQPTDCVFITLSAIKTPEESIKWYQLLSVILQKHMIQFAES